MVETQMVEAYPFVSPLPNPLLTNAETGAVGNSFFIGKILKHRYSKM